MRTHSTIAKIVCWLFLSLYTLPALSAPMELDSDQAHHISTPEWILSKQDQSGEGFWLPDSEDFATPQEGDARTATWYRFDVINRTDNTSWYVQITNTLIENVIVYTQHANGQTQQKNGYIKKTPFDLTNAVKIDLPQGRIVSVWVNIHAPYVSKSTLISVLPEPDYYNYHFNFTTMVLIAVGAMLALVIYNAFLYFPTRDRSFLWYASYQLLCTFCWAVHFKIMLYCFDLELDSSTLYLPFFIAGATSLMFAVSFLRLPNGSKISLLVRALAITLILVGLIGLLIPLQQYQTLLLVCVYTWLFIMLGLGIWRFNKGYRPARIYVIGFSVMTTFFIFTLAGNLAGTTLFDNQTLWALWIQLFDSVALALALADRINFLRKSRQHADKRATTDQLTGLPNRTAFERDIRAWEVYYAEGIIQEFYLTFIDVDGLKRVNDQLGHNEGDRLLSLVSQWLTEQSQQQNVYRIGGDEFVILSRHQIQWNLTSLHKILDDEGFPHSDISIGTSSYSESGNRSTLLKLADERMYAIKRSNR